MTTVLSIALDATYHDKEFNCGLLSNYCSGIGIGDWLWIVEFLLISIVITFFNPLNVAIYGKGSSKEENKLKSCIGQYLIQFFVTSLLVGVLVLCFFFLRTPSIPVWEYPFLSSCVNICAGLDCPFPLRNKTALVCDDPPNEMAWGFPTSFLIFLPAFIGFFGSFIFATFCGLGLISIPVDLVRAFLNRPKYIPRDAFVKLRLDLQKQTKKLIEIGNSLRDVESSASNSWKNLFK